jgi:hypothetical protein
MPLAWHINYYALTLGYQQLTTGNETTDTAVVGSLFDLDHHHGTLKAQTQGISISTCNRPLINLVDKLYIQWGLQCADKLSGFMNSQAIGLLLRHEKSRSEQIKKSKPE